jgi:hypothetical protein
MSRGLDSNQITILGKNSIVVENLLEIVLGAETAFITTAPYNTVATTTTNQVSATYLAANPWVSVSAVPDKIYTTENKIAITFEGDLTTALTGMTTAPLNFPNSLTVFRLHKLFRNSETNALESVNPIHVFTGILSKKTYTVGETLKRLQLDIVTNNKPYSFLPLNRIPSFGAL